MLCIVLDNGVVITNRGARWSTIISRAGLRPLAGVLSALPNVAQLFVPIMPHAPDGNGQPRPDEHAFDWSQIACLANLAHAMHRLRAVTLHVWRWCMPNPANTGEERVLLEELRSLSGALPPVEVQGFPADELAGIDLAGLNVPFHFATRVGYLRFREPREPYNPCW